MTLPDVDLDTPHTAPSIKTRFHNDDDVHDAGDAHFSEEVVYSTSTGLAQAATRHRRLLSEQTFAQHEREALLTRIAELEQALSEGRDHHDIEPSQDLKTENPPYVDPQGESSTGPSNTAVEDDGPHYLEYPSPPVSPPDAMRPTLIQEATSAEIECIRSLRVLDDGSPTLFTTDKVEASPSSNGNREAYLDGGVQVASPINA
jgi:hypothetical protein